MNSKMTFRSIAYSAICSAWLLASSAAIADITLQETGETLTGDMTISQEMGLTQGTNLLHTFLAFNVDAGESATFTGSNAITNIIARVSGDGASQIDGLLRSTITDANLFLINPNGVALMIPGCWCRIPGRAALPLRRHRPLVFQGLGLASPLTGR